MRLFGILTALVSLSIVPFVVACGSDEPRFRPSAREARGEDEATPVVRVATAEPVAPAGLPAPEDVGAVPEGAERTASGLASRVLRAGTGTAHPTVASTVSVHYTGWETNGRMFDSSRTSGAPASFPLGGVIAGWTEGLQLMVVGEERRFWIPADLAYGETPPRPGMPSGMLVFDVELLSIL
jgi:hypothetical protein